MAGQGNGRVDRTILLGRHGVVNILGASCTALAIRIALRTSLRPFKTFLVPHRLQLLDNGSGGLDAPGQSIRARKPWRCLSFTTGQRGHRDGQVGSMGTAK
jgi:hypothetical protein